MFETAAIPYGSAGKRLWTACLGMTGQTALVGLAILIPMLHPSVLPPPQALMTWLEAPVPPPPPPAPEGPAVVRAKPRPTQILNGALMAPARIPKRAIMIEDLPAEATESGSGPGVIGGMGIAAPGALLENLIASVATAAIARPVERAPETAPAPVPAAPIRVTIGGLVKDAVVIHRVEPIYPDLARRARIGGVVRLEGVIGTDGRIRELKVLSGHPLLTKAALDAVSQWLYRPTTLNGEPVEVIAPIIVTFRLN
ncbi:MAG: energy transducer TonB [Bryobacteraceae bacterium]|jgi:protein TonB